MRLRFLHKYKVFGFLVFCVSYRLLLFFQELIHFIYICCIFDMFILYLCGICSDVPFSLLVLVVCTFCFFYLSLICLS